MLSATCYDLAGTSSTKCTWSYSPTAVNRLLVPDLQVVVAAALLMLYVILQAFAIPGTIYLSLIAGALYGSWVGLAMVAIISTLGSSACYTMSALFGAPIAHAVWRDKLDDFRTKVRHRRKDLLSYIIFLRVTPILPNTFISAAAPIVGVPFGPFFLGESHCSLWGSQCRPEPVPIGLCPLKQRHHLL